MNKFRCVFKCFIAIVLFLSTTFLFVTLRYHTLNSNKMLFKIVKNIEEPKKLPTEEEIVTIGYLFGICSGLPAAARLGNMMFAYGSLLGLADRFNATVVLSSKHYDYLARIFYLNKFHFVDDNACNEAHNFAINEKWASKFDMNVVESLSKLVDDLKNHTSKTIKYTKQSKTRPNLMHQIDNGNYTFVLINNYLQSWRYFDNINIKTEFKFQTWIKSSVRVLLIENAKNIFCSGNVSFPLQFSDELYKPASIFKTTRTMKFKSETIECVDKNDSKTVLDVVYVGLHNRRTDMLNPSEVQRGYQSASNEYINNSIHFVESMFEKWRNEEYKKVKVKMNWIEKTLVFVVASDDNTNWIHDNVRSKYHLIQTSQLRSLNIRPTSPTSIDILKIASNHRESMGADMFDVVMDFSFISMCNHVIMTVGSFGWWAGYFSGGTVIYYKNFPRPNTEISAGFSAPDYYPPNWIAML